MNSAPENQRETWLFLLLPETHLHSLQAVAEPLRLAGAMLGNSGYDTAYISFDGAQTYSSTGITVSSALPPDRTNRQTTIVLCDSVGGTRYQNPTLLSWLRLQNRLGARIIALGTSVFVLARTGLLDGTEATTSARALVGFRERFSAVTAVDRLFSIAGRLATCAGGTAATDLTLQLIATAHGQPVSDQVAVQMLHPGPRSGETPQHPEASDTTSHVHPNVRTVLGLIDAHVSEPLSVPEIAARIGLSQRQLERQFSRDMGCTVVQFSLRRRLEHANILLASTGLSVLEISTATGFNAVSHFTASFSRHYGKPPSACRDAPADAPPPY